MRSREFRGITGVSVAYVRVNNKDFSLASRSALDAYSSYSVAARAPPHDHARTALAFDLRYRASVPTVSVPPPNSRALALARLCQVVSWSTRRLAAPEGFGRSGPPVFGRTIVE